MAVPFAKHCVHMSAHLNDFNDDSQASGIIPAGFQIQSWDGQTDVHC